MRFLFFPPEFPPIHAKSLEERPLSGGPTILIRLAQALSDLGHQVTVMTDLPNPPASTPRYLNARNYDRIGPVDVLIAVRGWLKVFLPIDYKKCFFWTGDAMTNPKTTGIGDRRFAIAIDALLAQSQWHADTLCEVSGFPPEKVWVFQNGVHMPYFEGEVKKERKRLIYSSTPQRGVQNLIPIFKKIKEIHPDAELYIFSSFDRNERQWPLTDHRRDYRGDETICSLLDEAAELPGCYVHSSITQEALAKEFKKAALWVYPTNFYETSCVTALEAQAGGCPMVTTDLAALSETCDGAGVLIPGDATTSAYQKQFIDEVDRLLTDEQYYRQFSLQALERAKTFDWSIRAQKLVDYLQTVHGLGSS